MVLDTHNMCSVSTIEPYLFTTFLLYICFMPSRILLEMNQQILDYLNDLDYILTVYPFKDLGLDMTKTD